MNKQAETVLSHRGRAVEAELRFYFHVEGGTSLQDKDGVDLPDHQAAQLEAVNYAFSLAQLEEGSSGQSKGGQVIVTDAGGQEVVRVPLPTRGRFRSEY